MTQGLEFRQVVFGDVSGDRSHPSAGMSAHHSLVRTNALDRQRVDCRSLSKCEEARYSFTVSRDPIDVPNRTSTLTATSGRNGDKSCHTFSQNKIGLNHALVARYRNSAYDEGDSEQRHVRPIFPDSSIIPSFFQRLSATRTVHTNTFYMSVWEKECLPALPSAFLHLGTLECLPEMTSRSVLALSACQMSRAIFRGHSNDFEQARHLQQRPDAVHQNVAHQ